ncbi:MAG: hypothetical protein ACPHJ3_20095, partial [Rubripirellula sp.]
MSTKQIPGLNLTRRSLLSKIGTGMGTLGLASLLHEQAMLAGEPGVPADAGSLRSTDAPVSAAAVAAEAIDWATLLETAVASEVP